MIKPLKPKSLCTDMFGLSVQCRCVFLTTKLIFVFFSLNCSLLYGQESQKFVVKGKIDTVPFAEYNVVYYVTFDSLVVQPLKLDHNSEFELIGVIPEPTNIEFQYVDSNNDRIVPYSFWVEPNKMMNFNGGSYNSEDRDHHYTLTNSPINIVSENYKILWKDSRLLKKPDRDSLVKKFITDNINNYYSVNLIWRKLRDEKPDYKFIDQAFAMLPPKLKQTNLAHDILRKRNLVIGATLPDFNQPDANGNTVKVSDFRGKYLLVEFWASWCPPCRAENPALVKTYKKYKEDGFEILGVSLDDDRGKWLQAIKDDDLPWQHVSDLKGSRGNAAGYELLIQGIPDNFLLDFEGKILARGLRGKELQLFLRDVFSKE